MDSIVAILKDGKVLNAIHFDHEPSTGEINQFVELHGGTEGRKLTEYEGVNHNQEIEEKIQPYPSWTWDSTIKQWLPPVAPPPIDEVNRIAYTVWNEADKTWQVAE
jgi:hypothetical protein